MQFPMRLTKLIASITALSFLGACITTHVNQPTSLDSGLAMSCAYNPAFSNPTMASIACAIENASGDWQNLKVESISFPDDPNASIVPPKDLDALAQAYAIKKNRDDVNLGLLLGGLVVAGALAMALANDKATAYSGAATYTGATSALAVKGARESYVRSQYGSPMFSEEHLLGGEFRVPPNLALDKKLVINHKGTRPSALRLCLASKTCYTISLN